jgi:hypothetical protein
LRPNIGQLQFGQLVWRKIKNFNSFSLDKWTTYFTSFLGTPSGSNSDSVWTRGDALFKMGFKFIFLVFFEELLHTAMWLTAQGLKGKVLRKKFVLSIESWIFFFSLFFFAHGSTWCHFQCNHYNLNVKFFIFVQEILQGPQCWSLESRPPSKKKFSSFIITNMELRFEPCILNLIWKWGVKDPKKEKTILFSLILE